VFVFVVLSKQLVEQAFGVGRHGRRRYHDEANDGSQHRASHRLFRKRPVSRAFRHGVV
jgi:hypothetical protein